MKQRTMDEMIAYFNQQVSEMDIDRKYKMALLGMITAIGYENKKRGQKWETCFDCPLSHGCPKINGCTNEQAEQYAGEIPEGCPIKRKTGKWIFCENETGEGSNTYKCSACGEIQMIISGTPKENGWKYCPHCGVKME